MFKEKIISFFYLKIFAIVFLLVIVGSIILKIGEEIVNSKFQNNSFSVLIVSKDSKFVSVNKSDKSAIFLALGDIRKYVKGKKPIEASFALGIPIDSILIDENPPANLKQLASYKNQLRIIFGGEKIVYKNLNRFDFLKFCGAINSSLKDNRVEERINIFNQEEVKKKVGNKLSDPEIVNSPLTIEINNGTSINGLGSLLAIILRKKGYNVISVKTSNENDNSYIAYPDEPTSFINSLRILTNFPILRSKKSQAADVTIFLGNDLEAMLSQ